jgi:hypothetical protein
MRRTFYLGVGAVIGVAATRKTRRAKEAAKAALTPSSIAADLADAIAELGHAVGSFAADVRAGMRERQAQLVPVVDSKSGSVVLTPPELAGPQNENSVTSPTIRAEGR